LTTNIKKHEFKEGLPHEFEIADLGQLYFDFPEILTSSFRTGFYHILWFKKGSPDFLVDFKPITITPDTILFIGKDTVQRFGKNSHFESIAILFTDSFFCKTEHDGKFLSSSFLFSDLQSVNQINICENDSQFTDLLRLMQAESEHIKDISQDAILKNLLHSFLLLSEKEGRKQDFIALKKGADLDYVLSFKELLDKYYSTLKKVSEYAKRISISEKQLNHATSKILDRSPKQMINERVMLEAKRLLAHTHKSVKEIGFSLGFQEPTNFTKYFRRHAELSPIAFREQYA
jgi:AraC-like DNA-binding protein